MRDETKNFMLKDRTCKLVDGNVEVNGKPDGKFVERL